MIRFTLISLAVILTATCTAQNTEIPVYLGTYTKKEGHVDGKAKGIFLALQDPENGSLHPEKTVAKITNPSFVKTSKDGKNLYAVSELGGGDAESGFIYSFKRNSDNSLEELGKLSTESFAPCHIELDQSEKFVFVSNYMGGVVMVYKRGEDGKLEKQQKIELENPEVSHAHSVSISSDNKTAYIADLGNDKIWIYNFNSETGKLSPKEEPFLKLEDGSGPRHFSFSKDEEFAFSINELNSSISVFKIEKDGNLKITQNISSIPADFKGKNSGADIHLHPSGKFIYTSNRGHNSIAAFKIDENSGELSAIGYYPTKGETPRNFAISPSGKFLYAANQDTSTISSFKVNLETGELQEHLLPVEVMSPVCVEFAEK
ncbi:lactonase family protein [Salegentibacter salegens]|uniref:6-phosphogluconolactonase n=1 Tax=Salegentibacter salegens TaxID=143223 RepID=A0A1M7LB55_9FLAO|nr:lactonase family protein [Salegentibacter salegens]PRX50589.1 6-phosphogluconolactonase [Salegentibacter salegens]SHM75304.1 6-phosphogluconolactonase [Salegentibacter salegens]